MICPRYLLICPHCTPTPSPISQHDVLDASLGFAAGVMTAASFWSLLEPALQMAEASGGYGENGEFAFLPVAAGFLAGAAFVSGADVLMKRLGVDSSALMLGEGRTDNRLVLF